MHKLLIAYLFVMMTLCLLMIREIDNGIENLGLTFDICMILSLGLGSSLIILKAAIFWKLVSPLARGSMFCFSGVMASCGVILLQVYGGDLYDDVRHDAPFIICGAFDLVTIIIGLCLWMCGKLTA